MFSTASSEIQQTEEKNILLPFSEKLRPWLPITNTGGTCLLSDDV